MTEQEITALGPAFAAYLRRFRGCFGQDRTAAHFDTYCRGLLSDLPRKSVEPIALAAGTAVRTLQEFLVTARWDHASARDTLQKHLGAVVADLPADPLGHRRGDRRDQLPQVGRPHAGRAAAVPRVRRQDRQRHRDRPRRGGQGDRSRPCWTPTCTCPSRGPRTARGAGRRASPTTSSTGQVAAGAGPVAAAERQRGVVRLAGVRRGVRGEGAVPEVPEPGRASGSWPRCR